MEEMFFHVPDSKICVRAGKFQGGGLHMSIDGTAGNDVLSGTDGKNTIKGFDGDDELSGLGGNDKLLGGNGNDTLYGGSGDDTLIGGEGTDYLYGGDGDDSIKAGNNDYFDSFYAGSGNDTIDFSGVTNPDAFSISTMTTCRLGFPCSSMAVPIPAASTRVSMERRR